MVFRAAVVLLLMSSMSIFPLSSGTHKTHRELDPVNRKGVPEQLFDY
jgi:hypothetical protein